MRASFSRWCIFNARISLKFYNTTSRRRLSCHWIIEKDKTVSFFPCRCAHMRTCNRRFQCHWVTNPNLKTGLETRDSPTLARRITAIKTIDWALRGQKTLTARAILKFSYDKNKDGDHSSEPAYGMFQFHRQMSLHEVTNLPVNE